MAELTARWSAENTHETGWLRREFGADEAVVEETRLHPVRYLTHPCLSPGGGLLACVVTDPDGYPFAVQRPLGPGGVGVGDERPVFLPVEGPVRRVEYSPDGRWLACEVAPAGGERNQIWLVTTDPDDTTAYTPYRFDDASAEIVCWDGERLALTAYDDEGVAEGRLVTPASDEVTVVDRRMGGELMYVRDGVGLFRVGSRGNRELLLVRPGGRWRPLLPPDPGSTTDAGVVLDSGAETGVTRALVRSDHSAGRARLLEVWAGEHGSQVREVAACPDADLDEFTVSLDRSVAVLLWNHDGESRVQVLDISGEEATDLPAPFLPTVMAYAPSITADGGLLAFTVEGPELPPRVLLWDVRRGRWTGQDDPDLVTDRASGPDAAADAGTASDAPPVGDPGPFGLLVEQAEAEPPVVVAEMGEPTFVPELVRYPARDGLELSAWVYPSRGSGPRPTLVYLHGGPEAQARPGFHDVLERAVAAGITVVAPNVRGSGGFGRAFAHADEMYARFSGLDDVADTVAHFVADGVSDPDRLIVSGRSYGGYLTLATLVRHPGLWRGGIAVCGMSDMATFYRDTEPWVAVAALPKYGHPLQERELLEEMSPLRHLHEVRVPVLFVHGENDSNVPPSESRQAKAELDAAGVWTELLTFDDEGHEFVKRPNRQVLGDRVIDFCGEVFGDVR